MRRIDVAYLKEALMVEVAISTEWPGSLIDWHRLRKDLVQDQEDEDAIAHAIDELLREGRLALYSVKHF